MSLNFLAERVRNLETEEPPVVYDASNQNVSDPPTQADANAAFGATAAQLRDGWSGIIDDNGAGTDVWLAVSKNDTWHFVKVVVGGGGVTGTGVATRVAFWSAASTLSSDANLYWDNGNKYLGVGTTTPDRFLHVETSDAVTNAVTYATRLSHITSGVAAAFFGTGLEWELEDAGGTNRIAATEEVSWASAAAISYSAYRAFYVSSNTSLQLFYLIDGTAAQMVNNFNPFGADIDFRAQGDTDTNAIFMQASSNYTGFGASAPATKVEIEQQKTLAASPADDYAAALTLDPSYTGNFTVTRHNYIDIQDVSLAGGAAVTDAAVMRFDAAAGTHKAVDSGTTKTTPGTVDAWIKCNINGTIYFVPAYLSKTT